MKNWTITRREFINACEDRGIKKPSLDAYDIDLKQFQTFMEARGHAPVETNAQHIGAYLLHMENKGLSLATRTRKLATLRVFGNYLVFAGELEASPAAGITLKRAQRIEEPVLPYVELRAIVDGLPSGSRDRALVELMMVGLNSAEIVLVERQHLDLNEGTLVVEERLVTLMGETMQELAVYLRETYPTDARPGPAYLFRNYAGRKLSRQALWKMVRDLKKCLSPQTIRRSAIAHMLKQGRDFKFIARQTGHVDPHSLTRYIHLGRSA